MTAQIEPQTFIVDMRIVGWGGAPPHPYPYPFPFHENTKTRNKANFISVSRGSVCNHLFQMKSKQAQMSSCSTHRAKYILRHDMMHTFSNYNVLYMLKSYLGIVNQLQLTPIEDDMCNRTCVNTGSMKIKRFY